MTKCEKCQYKSDKCSNEFNKSSTLCWCCRKVYCVDDPDPCEWAKYKQKVPNWEAEETVYRVGDKVTYSFRVISCPKFERG